MQLIEFVTALVLVMGSATESANKNKEDIVRLQDIQADLMQELLQEMTGFFTGTVGCDQVAPSAEFGFMLKSVPNQECFGEASEDIWPVLNTSCEDIGTDKSGKSVMLHTKGVFSACWKGQTINLAHMSKYTFDDNGTIVAYTTQFDTSALKSSHSIRPQYAEKTNNYAAGLSGQAPMALIDKVFVKFYTALAASAGFVLGVFMAVFVMRGFWKGQTPLSEDSYTLLSRLLV